jgi:hypothetical protein
MATTRAPERMPDQPCADCLDYYPAAARKGPALPRQVPFWLVALVLATTMLGTTLPTPLYVIYQAQWHFSAAIVTVTFAVYAVAVLATLLLAGRSSDQAGRKPVLATALVLSVLSTVVFILAPNVGVLVAGRILSGLSAGLMTGTATATLSELAAASDSRRASLVATAANMGGLGLGPLIAGLFAQYTPHPTVLVFEVYLVLLAVAGLCLFLVPETVSPRQRPAVRFAGLGIPEQGRSEFIAAGAGGFAAFSLLGLFAALAPTFLGNVLHQESHAVQGGIVPGGDGRGRGGRGGRLPGQSGHGQPPGPGRAAWPGHLRLLRRVLRRPDHPRGRRRGGLRVHQRLRGRARTVHPAGRPVPVRPGSHQERPIRNEPWNQPLPATSTSPTMTRSCTTGAYRSSRG